MSPQPATDRMAFVLAGLPPEDQCRLLTEAFTIALAGRPDLTPDVFRPWMQQVLVELRQRMDELE